VAGFGRPPFTAEVRMTQAELQAVLHDLHARYPDAFRALQHLRQNAVGPLQTTADYLSTFLVEQHGRLLRSQQQAASLLMEVPAHGRDSYHALRSNAEITVRVLCQLAGVAQKKIPFSNED
jgi:hypothetical protein